LVQTFKDPKIWRLFPEVIEVLSQLKSGGYKLGIVSNWSSALLHLCAALGLEHYMDVISVSAVIGWEKPSPLIFQKALSSIEVLPEEALYVGDTYQDDILGARNAGMQAILIDRLNVSSYPGPRIQDLRELYPLVRP
jgi:putative hydrolase of the HAD superfamily